jgi:RHS repeat-associated protein
VFFDNLHVRHDRGSILEENHYYAYGLKIPAISSKAYGVANNNFLYQGDYSEFDDDLAWNDFELRSYDPQIGRFLQNDPYDQFASGYVGMGDDPGANVDEDGGCYGCGIGKVAELANAASTAGDVVVHGSKALVGAKAAAAAAKAKEALEIAGIVARGIGDAVKNASTIGIYDFWGGNHLSDYVQPEQQAAYLRGRITGDAAVAAAGAVEFNTGTGAAAAGFATGPGALVISTAGVAVATYGAASGELQLLMLQSL